MPDASLEQLRARLLGERGPDPALLIELAPVLPESLFSRTMLIVEGIEDARLRAQVFAAFALRFTTWLDELLQSALKATREVTPDPSRAMALVDLAPQLPEALLSQAVEEAASIESEDIRGMTLVHLAPHLPEAAARAALAAAQAIETSEAGGLAIAALAERLADLGFLDEAIAAARTIRREETRAEALRALNSRRSRGLRRGGLPEERAGGPPSPAVRASDVTPAAPGAETPLPRLLERLPEADRAALLEEVLDGLRKKVRPVHYAMAKPPSSEEPREAEEAAGESPHPGDRVVNTGFAPRSQADQPVAPNLPLATGAAYYFWLEVGPPVEGSIETTPTPLPIKQLPPEARLTVALFSFEDEIELTRGADVGELKLEPNGAVGVTRQPARLRGIASDLLGRRLFFPVQVPRREGVCRLRVNIYCRQVLIQSRLVQAQVMRRPVPTEGALGSVLDYTLARALNPRQLSQMKPHRLSMMLNDNGDGTHGFRFFGAHVKETFKNDAALDEVTLTRHVKTAREALRMAAWGDKEQWTEVKPYRYASGRAARDLDRLRTDLAGFAISGYRFYTAIASRLAGGEPKAIALAQLMREPGFVQIASKQSARRVIPAAMFYDYPLDSNLVDVTRYTLCAEFLKALDDAAPLEASPCFQGHCPVASGNRRQTIICPSGFWGFRHAVGLPLTATTAPDPPAAVVVQDGPHLTVGVSTDPVFTQLAAHELVLKTLVPHLVTAVGDTRDKVLTLLGQPSHVVYFFCHGGLAGGTPYLEVGYHEPVITPDNLFGNKWNDPRPLVFLNGCHTTALDPDVAYDFVGAFVEDSWASGVIGTEITIFEPLARAFAEECLRRFLAGESIGEAVRMARLKLLKDGNPLGLVYIPYVIPSLHLVPQEDASPITRP